MSMKWIRKHYNVPAKRGMEVIAERRHGVIVGSKGEYLRVRIDGEKNIMSFHPEHEMKYIIDLDKKRAYFGIEHKDTDFGYGIVAESIIEAKQLLWRNEKISDDCKWIDLRVTLRPDINVGNLPIGIVEDLRLSAIAGFCSMIREFPCDVCGNVSDVQLCDGKVVCDGCYDYIAEAKRKASE